MLEAEALAAEIEAAGGVAPMMPVGETYVVVETSYPTQYLGREWTRAELLHQSSVAVHGPYATVDAATRKAWEVREASGLFRVGGDCLPASPPWDSGLLLCADDGDDRGSELRLEVLEERAYGERQESEATCLRRAQSETVFKKRVEAAMRHAQVVAAGRVHYSDPPEAYDIAADLEVDSASAGDISEARAAAALPLRFVPLPPVAPAADGGDAAPDDRGDRAGPPPPPAEEEASAEDGEDGALSSSSACCALASLVARCPNLAELHYRGRSVGRGETDAALSRVAKGEACRASLTLLRVQGRLSPQTLGDLAGLRRLERLDISDSFVSEFFDFAADRPTFPYDAPLRKCLESMPGLAYLDLGHGDDDALQTFWDYCVSQDAMAEFQARFPGVHISMAEKRRSPIPHPFPGGDLQREEAFFGVVGRLGEDDDPAVRAAAREYLADLTQDDAGVDLADLALRDDGDDTYFLNDDEDDGDSDSS